MNGIDPYQFRNLCGRFATGIGVVTAFDENDKPVGMTVNSFSSVSLEPPLISIAIEHSASAWAVLEKARLWTVNILEANQESLSRRFAAATPDRFDGVGWQRGADGSLMFDGALAQIVCERWGSMEAGDHTILLGLVVGGKAADHGRPLLYYRGGYTEPDQL